MPTISTNSLTNASGMPRTATWTGLPSAVFTSSTELSFRSATPVTSSKVPSWPSLVILKSPCSNSSAATIASIFAKLRQQRRTIGHTRAGSVSFSVSSWDGRPRMRRASSAAEAMGRGERTHFQVSDPPFSFVMMSEVLVIQTPTLPGNNLHERESPTTPPQCDSALAESTASSGGHKLYPLAIRPAPGVVGRTAAAAVLMAPNKPRAVLLRRAEGSPPESGPSLSGGGSVTLGELDDDALAPPSDGARGDSRSSREGGGMGTPSW